MRSLAISNLGGPAISLANVGVCYRLPRGRVRTAKEAAILWIQRRLVFEQFWPLRGLDLAVPRGECLGVIGRNGAGKSTLLQVMARVVHPTEGSVEIRGRIAPLLQLGAGFDVELSGRENVYLNGALLGMSRAEISDRFDAIVDFAELEDFIDVPLRAYSSGMAARLGFAVATASQPDILLVDEALSVGDAAFQIKCANRMDEFASRGATMVLVSHDPLILRRLCHRVIWIENHGIRADGEPDEIMNGYHLFLTGETQESSGPAMPRLAESLI